jgi:hypothetical protein
MSILREYRVMRFNILVFALLSSAVSAQAGSIDVITTGKDLPRSVEKISCDACIKAIVPKKTQSVVELTPGTQKFEIRDVGGVKKIYRTEAWLGGSPVVYVSNALPDDPLLAANKAAKSDEVASAPADVKTPPSESAEADMIDENSTTAAVTADMGAEAKVETAPKVQAFDPGKLELRLN